MNRSVDRCTVRRDAARRHARDPDERRPGHRRPARAVDDAQYVLAPASVQLAGRGSADNAKQLNLYRVNGPRGSRRRSHGLYPTTPASKLVGRARHYDPFELHGGTLGGEGLERPEPLPDDLRPSSPPRTAPSSDGLDPRRRPDDDRFRSSRRGRRLPRATSRSRPRAARRRSELASTDTRPLGLHFTPLRLHAVRIVFDVSPAVARANGRRTTTSAARCRGSPRRRPRRHEIVAFAPTSPLRAARDPGASLDGVDVERRLQMLPAAHALAHALVEGGHAARRAVARPIRRPPLQRLDVSAAAGRRTGDDDPRPRSAPLPGLGDGANTRDARREVPPCGEHVRRRRRQLAVHRRRRRDDARHTRRGSRRVSGGRRRVHARRAACGRRVRAHGRDARAAQEPREARRGARSRAGVELRVVGSRGWGGAASATAAASSARPRRRAELARALSWCRRVPLPVAVRGLRHARDRGDGVRRAVVVSAHPSLDESCGTPPCASTPTSRGDRGGIEQAFSDRDGLARAVSRMPPLLVARERPRASRRRGVPRGKVAVDMTPLGRRAPAPPGTSAPCCRVERTVTIERKTASRERGRGRSAADLAWYPPCSAVPRRRRPPLPDVSGAVRTRCRSSSRCTTSPSSACRRGSRRGRARTAASSSRASCAAADRRPPSRSSPRARSRRCSASRATDPRRAERRRDVVHADGPRAEGDYVLAVGTLEPRKNLAPSIAAGGRRRAARRGCARLGRRRAAGRA